MELAPSFPSAGSVFDYCVSVEHSSFVSWVSLVPTFEYVADTPFFDILVPTGETTCYEYVLGMLIAQVMYKYLCLYIYMYIYIYI